uniref:MFS transporter n=1 Tax=Nonomuraea lactucae TaxID=2249762 RepID=UPI0013B3FAF8
LAAGLATVPAVRRWGRSRVRSGALLALAGAIVALCAGPGPWLTLPAAVVIGWAWNAALNVVTTVLSDHHGPFAPAVLSEANAIGVGGGILAPLALGLASLTSVGWRAGLLVAALLAAGAWSAGSRESLPASAPGQLPTGSRREGAPTRSPDGPRRVRGAFPRPFWIAWALFLACSGFEMCMLVWGSEELRIHARLPQATATMGITLMLVGMLVGRLAGARLARRWPTSVLLACSVGVALAGFAVFWLADSWLALAGILLCGLGMSLHFPLAVARALAAAGGRSDAAMSRFTLGLGVASGLGPFVLSAIAAPAGIHQAFLAGFALLFVALVLAWRLTVLDRKAA